MAKKRPVTLRAAVTSEARTLQARAAALQRFHPERADEIAELRRRAVAIHLEAHIKRAIPVLTVEERGHLVRALAGANALAWRKTPDDELQSVALVYRDNFDYAPRAAVAAAMGYTMRTASRQIDRARKRGYLPPTTQGKKLV